MAQCVFGVGMLHLRIFMFHYVSVVLRMHHLKTILFKFIIVLCGIDSISWNILHVHTEYEECLLDIVGPT